MIWFVFANGFGIMHREMIYRPNQTPLQMYNCMDNLDKLYKMTKYGLEEDSFENNKKYLEKRLDKTKI